MQVHRCGALAVPRNAFLQPEAVVERLDDHRSRGPRPRARGAPRGEAQSSATTIRRTRSCRTTSPTCRRRSIPRPASSCSLFAYCRSELRASHGPADVLIEIGVPPRLSAGASPGSSTGPATSAGQIPARIVDQVAATVERAGRCGSERGRTDPVGLPGAIYVVGREVGRGRARGPRHRGAPRRAAAWETRTFLEPQAPTARRGAMELIGAAIVDCSRRRRAADPPRRPGPARPPTCSSPPQTRSPASSSAGCAGSVTWTRAVRP